MKTSLSEPILLIANLSFETNTFLETLKQANVTPIFKKDDHTLCNNYRPISLLLNIIKIIEILVHKRLTKFLNLNDMSYKQQLDLDMTNHTLLELKEKIRLANDNEKYSCGIFLDTVNHDILLEKLEIYGIRGIKNKWFKPFLKD